MDEDSVVSHEAKAIFLDNIVRFFGMFPDDAEILLLKGALEDLIDDNNTDMRGEKNTYRFGIVSIFCLIFAHSSHDLYFRLCS